MKNKEIRAFEFEVRAEETEGHGHTLNGRPIVFGQRTDLGWYDEIIEQGALDETDLKDVRFLVNHNTSMIPLARSRNNNANSTMQMSVDADVYGKHEIERENHESQIQMHQSGKSDTEDHDELVDCIYRMVQIISIDRPLVLSDPGKCSVQRISVPVHGKSKRAEPKPVDV